MAKLFLKIIEKFTISDLIEDDVDDPVGPVAEQYKKNNPQLLKIIFMFDGRDVLFTPGPDEVTSGRLKIELIGERIEVDCDAIFKINAKSDYVDELLKPNGKWRCTGLQGIVGEISGLEQESYKYKDRFGEGNAVRHLLKVKVAKSGKELK